MDVAISLFLPAWASRPSADARADFARKLFGERPGTLMPTPESGPSLDERSAVDAALMRRIASGDSDALAGLYDRQAGPLYAAAVNILRDPAEAQDVVHDVFVALWQKSADFAVERGTVFAWAVTLVRNRSIDRLRTRRRRAGLLEASVPADLGYSEAPGADESAALGDRARAVRAALAELPAEQRRALELAFFSGLTQQEIADRLKEPLGTVKARIRRALFKLRDTLARRL